MEQMSMMNGELEDRLKEVEGLLDETSRAMEALRVSLQEERDKVTKSLYLRYYTEARNECGILVLGVALCNTASQR